MNEKYKWLYDEGLMPDIAFYQLYDDRPIYTRYMEQKKKRLKEIEERNHIEEPEIGIVINRK